MPFTIKFLPKKLTQSRWFWFISLYVISLIAVGAVMSIGRVLVLLVT